MVAFATGASPGRTSSFEPSDKGGLFESRPGREKLDLCAVIPSYNAAETLEILLDALIPMIRRVVVVDDGSNDDTSAVFARFVEKGVVFLRHETNLGKGAALRTGLAYALRAGFKVAATLDSDLQHAPEDLPRVLEVFESDRLDLLVGSRIGNMQRMPGIRRFGNRFSSWIAGRFCHQAVPDSQCGYRVFRLPTCAPLLKSLTLDRFDAETEILVKAALRNLRIGFAPIQVLYPENGCARSHYRAVRDTALIVRFYTLEYCRRVFTPSGRRDVKGLSRSADSPRRESNNAFPNM